MKARNINNLLMLNYAFLKSNSGQKELYYKNEMFMFQILYRSSCMEHTVQSFKRSDSLYI